MNYNSYIKIIYETFWDGQQFGILDCEFIILPQTSPQGVLGKSYTVPKQENLHKEIGMGTRSP